jgi:uncharacterized Zn finger protein
MSWGWYPSSRDRKRSRKNAQRETAKIKNASPVVVEGRTIARSFWGKAWCDNLESYSDYENRLPRGRTYCRNGSIADLKIEQGHISARVVGSSLYKVNIEVVAMPSKKWAQLVNACGRSISSMVELLEGRLSSSVMETVIDRSIGLFPAPKEISLSCSCPDWADMCKHVAAVMYGVGNRLDKNPELLFTLRSVEVQELLASSQAINSPSLPSSSRIIASVDLWEVFEIENSLKKPKGRKTSKALSRPKRESKPSRVNAVG